MPKSTTSKTLSAARLPDTPELELTLLPPGGDDSLKQVNIRIPNGIKISFRYANLRQRVDVQHVIEAFIEHYISYTDGVREKDVMDSIVRRARSLMTRG